MRTIAEKFQGEELPHELFLTARQKTKIRNTFTKNMSANIKLRFLCSIVSDLGDLGKEMTKSAVTVLAIPCRPCLD